MLLVALRRNLLLAIALATGVAGCTAVQKTNVLPSILRKDVLTDAQNAIAQTQINHGELTIEGSVDRADTTYDTGQPIGFTVKTNKDAHVAILRVLPNGDTTLLFPNGAHPKSDIAANAPLTVPAPDDAVKVNAPDKSGIVLFLFVASSAGDSWLFKRKPDKDSDFADLGVTSRAIARDIVNSLKVGKGPETAAMYVTIRVGGGLF